MRTGLHVLCFVAITSIANAQSSTAPFPGGVLVNGGWVPCSHQLAIAAGKGCGATPVPSAATPCDPWPNPYTEQARLMTCLASRPVPTPTPQTVKFEAGERFADGGYPSLLAICLATGTGVDGRPYAVLQRLTDTVNGPAGQVFVIRPDEHHIWIRYRGGEQ